MKSDSRLLGAIEEFDLETYLQDKGFRALSSVEWVGPCPRCHKEDKVAVNAVKRTWHCWVCQEYETAWDGRVGSMRRRPVAGAGGLLKLLEWLDELDTAEAVELVLSSATLDSGGDLPTLVPPNDRGEFLRSGQTAPIPFPEGARAITSPLPYMLRRGISMSDVQTYGLFWCAEGRYRNRIVFPVWEDGHLVYWQARAMFESSDVQGGRFIKALNPPKAEGAAVSSDVLMNLDLACQYPRVAVVEGPMDVVRTGPDAVCTFGKQLYPRQLERLVRRGVRAVDLMWDGPTDTEPYGAQQEMVSVAPWLSTYFDTRLVFLPRGDPGDWDCASLRVFRASGIPAGKFTELRL